MHIEMPHLLMVSYLGKRSRSIDNKCTFINKKYAIKADNVSPPANNQYSRHKITSNTVEEYMYIANSQLDERSRPIDNKYAFTNMHRIIMSCMQKTRVNRSILVLL